MSMTDLIADCFTRIRNAQNSRHEQVDVIRNNLVEEILKILKKEGFIENYAAFKDGSYNKVKVDLKYYNNKPVIRGFERISKPGKRAYNQVSEIKPAMNNIGVNIFSTSKGVLTGKEAKLQNIGGEYICKVW
jgi:small subunit ribosomal protein S8